MESTHVDLINIRQQRKVDSVNNIAGRFKAVRKLLGLTQQGLADELLMSRNYIAKIEAGIQEPGPRVLVALEAARVRLVNKPIAPSGSMVEEEQAAYGATQTIASELERKFSTLLALADGDPERLHWIAVQMKEHLVPPKSWRSRRSASGMVRVTLPSQTTLLSTETGLPVPSPSRPARQA